MKSIRLVLLCCSVLLATAIARADSEPRNCHETWNPESLESNFPHPSTFKKQFQLMEQGDYRTAADSLARYDSKADIFFTDYNDGENYFRSTERLHMLAFCQLKMGAADQARLTLKAMFGSDEKPPYVWGNRALSLLVYLEPSAGLSKFLEWATAHKVNYERKYTYSPTLEGMIAIRKDIEADRFESALKSLSEYQSDRFFSGFEPQAHLIMRWLLDHPKSLAYLLAELKKRPRSEMSCLIFTVGEFFDASAIPVLLAIDKSSGLNGPTLQERALALAKSGYKGAIRLLYDQGTTGISEMENCLLQRLTGVSFGPIKGDNSARLKQQWKAWIDTHPDVVGGKQ